MKQLVWSLPLAFLLACGAGTGSSGSDNGEGGGGGEGGSGPGSSSSTSSSSTSSSSTSSSTSSGPGGLTEMERLQIFCEKTMLAGCPAWFSSTAQCVDIMSKTQSDLCEDKWVAETDCLGKTQAGDWGCNFGGEPEIVGTVCRDEYGFGSYCRIAVATPECYGAACMYDADCPGEMKCNDATEHCLEANAQCGGLPCKYDADCPSAFKCNDALGQCVLN
ncbi:hypothetical protein [Polyangium sp. y55x31]|uniref:hypothetical protein n=1 Tax=Polyangium sp. y55x31 TaxID=3042688 RepID=UPI0024824689|nr:hypothetical protein [Polyangium sp. y55x31]MDI1480070.1 hypothetical protein [Polyangium sp. y55x31]